MKKDLENRNNFSELIDACAYVEWIVDLSTCLWDLNIPIRQKIRL